jgi:N-acetylneuraminic acid mutarotase
MMSRRQVSRVALWLAMILAVSLWSDATPASGSVSAAAAVLTWSAGPSLPYARSYGGAAAVNGKVYMVGGYTFRLNAQPPFAATLAEIDAGSNTWMARADMPGGGRTQLGVAELNGKLYAVGGHGESGVLGTVEAYDPLTGAWETRASMTTVRSGLAMAALNGKLYSFGGGNQGGLLATVEEYDPQTDSWTPMPSMPTARTLLGAAALNGKLYAIGGHTGNTAAALTTVEELDPSTGIWATKAPMATKRFGLGIVAGGNGKLYAVGGFYPRTSTLPQSEYPTNIVEEYDPSTDSWTSVATMPTARHGLSTAVLDGVLYAVAGEGPSGISGIFERALIREDTTAPTVSSFQINGGATASASQAATLSLTATDDLSGVAQMSFSNNGGTAWSDWESYGTTKTWTLASGDGPKSVLARVRDATGHVSQPTSDAIQLDTRFGSSYGVSINNAAVWTNTTAVNLSIPAAPGTARMMISNDGGFQGAAWEPFNTQKAWTLDTFVGDPVTMIVYVRFGDASGVELPNSRSFDNIILDIDPPDLQTPVIQNGQQSGRSGTSGPIGIQSPVQTVLVTASDTQSGVGMQMRLSNRADFAGAVWKPYTSSVSWDFSGGGTVYVQVRDGAGNLSPVRSQSLPGASPPGTSPTPSCSPRPPVPVELQKVGGTLVATLSTTGANNGLRAVRFDSFTTALVDAGDQTSQSAPFAVSIPAGQEPTSLQFVVRRQSGASTATVRLVVIDGCGEWSTFVGGGLGAW